MATEQGKRVPSEAVKEALRELDREGRASYHGLMDGGLGELYPAIRAEAYEDFKQALLGEAQAVGQKGHEAQSLETGRQSYAEAAAIREAVEKAFDHLAAEKP